METEQHIKYISTSIMVSVSVKSNQLHVCGLAYQTNVGIFWVSLTSLGYLWFEHTLGWSGHTFSQRRVLAFPRYYAASFDWIDKHHCHWFLWLRKCWRICTSVPFWVLGAACGLLAISAEIGRIVEAQRTLPIISNMRLSSFMSRLG